MAPPVIIDQPPEALDKVYAQSLFELAEKEGGRERLESISDEMDQLFEIRGQDPQAAEFLRSRVIPSGVKVEVLRKVFGGRVDDLILRMLLLLARKERLDRVWRVFTAFQNMLDEKFGNVEVDVFTRFPLEQAEVNGLRDRLRAVLKREPIMHAYVDEGMVGGMKLQVGDKMMDASITTTLRRMREQMLEGGANEVRSRMGRILGE